MNFDFWYGMVTGTGIACLIFCAMEALRSIPSKRVAKKEAELMEGNGEVYRIPNRTFSAIREMQEPEVKIPGTNDFSVAGRPRTVPWHIRRKELEAAARTKRKKRESFQDLA